MNFDDVMTDKRGHLGPTLVVDCDEEGPDALRVTFVNVGQGDCTLVRSGDCALLFDGGRANAMISPRLSELSDRTCGLDLLVGSHYDGDHLCGLTKVIEHFEGRVRFALVPPVIHPTRRIGRGLGARYLRRSPRCRWSASPAADGPFLAYALHQHGLAGALKELDQRAELLGSAAVKFANSFAPNRVDRLEDSPRRASHPTRQRWAELTQPANTDVEREDLLHDVFEVMRAQGLSNLARVAFAALTIVRSVSGGPAGAAGAWQAALAMSGQDAQIAGAIKSQAAKAITARWLDTLIRTLNHWRIDWDVTLAPPSAKWLTGTPQLCQLEPVSGLVRQHMKLIPQATALELSLNTPPSTPANQLSYAFALRANDCGPAVLITGDSGFERLPSGSRDVIAACSLVDVSHHGGQWGCFGDAVADAHAASSSSSGAHQGRPMILYTSAAEGGANPPTDRVQQLRAALATRGCSVHSLYANMPEPAAIGCCEKHARTEGPPALDFVATNSGWQLLTPGSIECCC
jgi:hypothetical protein